MLQNFTQLDSAYGETEAKTIKDGGFSSKLFYPGLPPNTAEEVSKLLGEAVSHRVRWDGQYDEKSQDLLTPDRVRTLPDNNAIFVTGNKEPMLIETEPSFLSSKFSKMRGRKHSGIVRKRDLPQFERVSLS